VSIHNVPKNSIENMKKRFDIKLWLLKYFIKFIDYFYI
jgi:hypothetical protein